MLPGSYLAGGFLLALVPGWTYLRLRARRDPSLPRTGLDQTLEVVAVGLMTTGLAVALWALLPASGTHLLDITELAVDGGGAYARANVRRAVATVLVVLVAAQLLAYGLFHALHRNRSRQFRRETVWAGALGHRTRGGPWMGVEMRDGRLIEGWLLAYPTGDEHEHRDLALQATLNAPIRVTKPGEPARTLAVERAILAEADIASITMTVIPDHANQLRPLRGGPERWQRFLDRLYRRLSVRPTADDSSSAGRSFRIPK